MSRTVFIFLLCAFLLAVGFLLGRRSSGEERPPLREARLSEETRSAASPAAPKVSAKKEAAASAAAAKSVPEDSSSEEKLVNGNQSGASGSAYLEGELILRPKEGVSMAQLIAFLKEKGIAVIGDIPELGLIRVVLPEDLSVPQAEKFLQGKDEIADTVRNAPVSLDPLPGNQELMQAKAVGSSALGMMSANESGTFRNGEGILVAVLDTGVDETHPALAGQTISGYDFVSDMAYQKDLNGHGTACASLIAGRGGENVAGVAPMAKILPVKVMDDKGKSDGFSVAQGIIYAVKKGARIINMSLGTSSETNLLDEALNYAMDHECLVVAASGNEGKEGENYPSNLEGVLCVGAVDGEKWKASFSNYGPKVDLVAPGVLVAAAYPNGGTVLMSGTSSAAPLVSGAAASLWSENPNWSAAEVADKLMAEADDLVSPGADDWYGSGLVNMHRARRKTKENDMALTSLYFDPPDLVQGKSVTMVAVFQNQGTERVSDGSAIIKVDSGVKEIPLPALDPGASYEVREDLTLPEGRAKREMYLEVKVETKRAEARLDNNGQRIVISERK
ncbi:S8 family serine peptidase [bacterium]|nr:S8 family serine peptidase [bacterium]